MRNTVLSTVIAVKYFIWMGRGELSTHLVFPTSSDSVEAVEPDMVPSCMRGKVHLILYSDLMDQSI